MKEYFRRIRKKSGTTMVEMIVSLLLVELLAIMVIGVLSPAAKMFVRVQRLQFAQMILDNVAEEMKSQVQSAVGTVKIYNSDVLGSAADSGTILEFMNTDGYIVLISADGCAETTIIRGAQETGDKVKADTGEFLMRYYWPKLSEDGKTYTYNYIQNGIPVARAVNPVFTNKYYMGNYLKMEFAFPDGITEGTEVTSIIAKVSIYSDEACQNLLAEEEIVLNIRYQAKRAMNMPSTAIVAAE